MIMTSDAFELGASPRGIRGWHERHHENRHETRGRSGRRGGGRGSSRGITEHGRERHMNGRRGRGDRARRGDVRAAILLALEEQPMHGYQLIQEIGERSGGVWQPSAGAIYPALALLEDEGFVTITADGGRKMAALTDEGRTHIDERRE